jgi:hypothetical protein
VPFVISVGIAWFDERPPPMEEVTLRTGGLPLMQADTPWPTCPLCARAMLFRAQLPLAVSGLVGFDDGRVVLVFECHDRLEGERCSEGAVVFAEGHLEPREPPTSDAYRVTVTHLGDDPDRVHRLVDRIGLPWAQEGDRPPTAPFDLLWSAPPSIAEQTAREVEGAGGTVEVWPSPPTVTAPVGGKLVPFDDDVPWAHRTTLPPLRALATTAAHGRLLGLLGGFSPGARDSTAPCGCGRRRRTVVRLVAVDPESPSGVVLGPTTVQACLRCGTGTTLRSLPPS